MASAGPEHVSDDLPNGAVADSVPSVTGAPTTPYSSLAQGALAVVPAVITLWPPLLMGLHAFSHRREEVARQTAAATEETHHG